MLFEVAAAVVLTIAVAVWLARISPRETESRRVATPPPAPNPAGGAVRCVLCNAPLRDGAGRLLSRPATDDPQELTRDAG
jgi:hypothetical protein